MYLDICWIMGVSALLYALSLMYIAIKVASYKRKIRIYGGFNYGYLEQQGFYARAATAVALITSIASVSFNTFKEIPIFLPMTGMACIFIAVLLTRD